LGIATPGEGVTVGSAAGGATGDLDPAVAAGDVGDVGGVGGVGPAVAVEDAGVAAGGADDGSCRATPHGYAHMSSPRGNAFRHIADDSFSRILPPKALQCW
jgi:hypothetical protein